MRYVFFGFALSAAVGATKLDLLPLGEGGRAYELGAAEAGSIFDTTSLSTVEIEELANRLAEADVVLLGEEHTAMDQKLVHARLVERMAEAGATSCSPWSSSSAEMPRPRPVGPGRDRRTRAAARRGGGTTAAGYRWEYYRPVMEVARTHGIPVVGVNVPREIPREVNRGGLEALRRPAGRSGGGGHRRVAPAPLSDHALLRRHGRDAATGLVRQHVRGPVPVGRGDGEVDPRGRPGTTVVLVVGSGHIAYDLGIARRLDDERAAARPAPGCGWPRSVR